MNPSTQIERPAPRLQICPICKQPSHLGCDHAVIEFQADQREKERQRHKERREKINENKDRAQCASVEKTEESNGSGVEKPKNAVESVKPESTGFNALNKAWMAASPDAQRYFVRDRWAEIQLAREADRNQLIKNAFVEKPN